MRRLIASVLTIFPFPFCRRHMFVARFELRQRRGLLREDVRFIRPRKTVQQSGICSRSKIHADGASDDQKDNEASQNQTTFAHASHPTLLARRRTFNPSLHLASSDAICAAFNFW